MAQSGGRAAFGGQSPPGRAKGSARGRRPQTPHAAPALNQTFMQQTQKSAKLTSI